MVVFNFVHAAPALGAAALLGPVESISTQDIARAKNTLVRIGKA